MSNSIKDIIKTFKTLQDEPQPVVETPVETPSVEKAAEKPKTIKKEVAVQKAPEKKEKAVKQAPKAKEISSNDIKLTDEFFAALSGQEFVYEDRRIAYIETDLYEIFMSIKRKKKLKNISVLINAILNQFVEENKEDIKQILANTRL